jgi:hypothetical protein
VERTAYVVGTALIASGSFHLGVLIASGTTWEGPLSYRKAATFGLSFGLTLVTVAWVTAFIDMRPRRRDALLGLFTAASVMETVLVTVQVWRRVPSHFDLETSFDTTVSMTLAVGGAVLIVTILGFTAAAIRASGTPPMRLALRYGFVVLVVALGTGAVMIAHGISLARSGHQQLAYSAGGTLKPVHGVTMHAILVIPGFAWLLERTGWSQQRQMRLTRAAIALYTLAIATVVIVT